MNKNTKREASEGYSILNLIVDYICCWFVNVFVTLLPAISVETEHSGI